MKLVCIMMFDCQQHNIDFYEYDNFSDVLEQFVESERKYLLAS